MEPFKIQAFGMLAEKLPATEFSFPYHNTTTELLNGLNQAYPSLREMNFSLAVEKQLVQDSQSLKGGEEIGLLPPFSGG